MPMALFLQFILFACSAIVLAEKPELGASQNIISLHYPALYPESIVWDDEQGVFISGSITQGSLFSITETGKVDQFIHDADYSGMAATGGVAIDPSRRRILTVINNIFDNPSGFHGLASYNLDTKDRIFLAKFSDAVCPNDVAVDPGSGFAYVTDSARNFILKISPAGDSSVFAEDEIFKSQPVFTVDPATAGTGLNGIAFTENYLLVVQSNSGKLFRVMSDDAAVHVVKMEKLLIAADAIRMRQDGLLIAVSTGVLWILKSRDRWESAFVVDEILLDRAFFSTSIALKGPKDDATIVHAYFQDFFAEAEEGKGSVFRDKSRDEFSLQKIQLPGDPDRNPLWLLLIPVIFLVLFGIYKFQMKSLFDKYSRLAKRD